MNNCSIQSSNISPFHRESYYEVAHHHTAVSHRPRVHILMKENGIRLLTEYYCNWHKVPSTFVVKDEYEIFPLIKQFREQTVKEIRIPFISINTLSPLMHSTPMVYVKDGKEEALLYFDSLGSIPYLNFKDFPLKKFAINKCRQRDFYSCHTDALVFIKELAGKDESGHYFIPNILDKLNEHCVKDKFENIHIVQFTHIDRLLKTCQKKYIIEQNKLGTEIIHVHQGKEENLDQFLARYQEESQFGDRCPKINGYLRQKAIKFANLIEMQYYLNEIVNHLGCTLRQDEQKKFIAIAKLILKFQPSLTPATQRLGLYQYANYYLTQIKANTVTRSLYFDASEAFAIKHIQKNESFQLVIDTLIAKVFAHEYEGNRDVILSCIEIALDGCLLHLRKLHKESIKKKTHIKEKDIIDVQRTCLANLKELLSTFLTPPKSNLKL